MLASGDPLGDPEAWPGAIHAFLDEAARHAWVPAVIGCSELGAEVWCREGDLTALELGDEAIVNVADFSLPAGRCATSGRWYAGVPARLHGRGPPGRRHPADEIAGWSGRPTPGGAAPPSAGSPWRSAGSAGRGDDGLRDRHGHRGRRAAGRAALRALGQRRALAGPDAPGPVAPSPA